MNRPGISCIAGVVVVNSLPFHCRYEFFCPGLPDGLFSTQNPNFGQFWRALQWKILVYFMTIWSTLRPLEIFYGHLVYFVVRFWYFVPRKIWQPCFYRVGAFCSSEVSFEGLRSDLLHTLKFFLSQLLRSPVKKILKYQSGLPDGLFSNQNSQFGKIFRGPWNEKGWYTHIFLGHLEYITVIWYILWPFGNLVAVT
jgi:hypothetical protein